MRPRLIGCVAAIVVGVTLTSCSDTPDAARPSDPTPATDDTAEAGGNEMAPRIVLDLSSDTSTEPPIAGLLSIALTPDGRHLLTLQNTIGNTVTMRSFPYSPGVRLVPDDGWVVMRLDHPYVHSGGGMVVDAEGDVLVGIAAFLRPDEPLGPQNPDGSVLRVPNRYVVDPDAGVFVPGVADVVARGLRQPWRITLDRDTGDLWIGDVGEGREEEVNRVAAADLHGDPPNFGWPYLEGPGQMLSPPPPDLVLSDAELSLPRDDASVGIVGGYRYRGSALPTVTGSYVFADLAGTELMAFDPDATPPRAEPFADIGTTITSFGEDVEGELLAIDSTGTVYRVEPATDPTAMVGTARRVGSMWPIKAQEGASEATSVIAEPGGDAYLASERGGLITRMSRDLAHPSFCPFAFDLFPQLAYAQPDDRRAGVEAALDLLDRHGDALPLDVQPQVARSREVYDHARALGSRFGWDSSELDTMMRETAVERGEFADAQRATETIFHLGRTSC